MVAQLLVDIGKYEVSIIVHTSWIISRCVEIEPFQISTIKKKLPRTCAMLRVRVAMVSMALVDLTSLRARSRGVLGPGGNFAALSMISLTNFLCERAYVCVLYDVHRNYTPTFHSSYEAASGLWFS